MPSPSRSQSIALSDHEGRQALNSSTSAADVLKVRIATSNFDSLSMIVAFPRSLAYMNLRKTTPKQS